MVQAHIHSKVPQFHYNFKLFSVWQILLNMFYLFYLELQLNLANVNLNSQSQIIFPYICSFNLFL